MNFAGDPVELKRVCVFCGSSSGKYPEHAEAARAMGRAIARRGIELVFGGGHIGLMGILADAALAEKGRVIGVIPEALMAKELGHGGLTELRVVNSMHDRKLLMAQLSDAFIALPGGFGTLEEFCEVLTWAQLGLHRKPCGLLNVRGYYDPVLEMFDRARAECFLTAEHRALVRVGREPDELIEQLAQQPPPPAPKWIGRDET